MTLATGTRLGPYEILAPIGAGGMGEVYKASDTRLERTVAVKVLPAHLSQDVELKARLVREARAISSLSHPHICALYDVGEKEGVDYLVMEYLEGETLADRLKKGPITTEVVLRYGIEIAEALDKAHRHGIVHRDLKPGNVMLTKSGVKLLDFGLAKLRATESEPSLSYLPTRVASKPLTEKGTILGTFQYMSPEQLEGKEADARSDIFALGAVLHEIATGKKAFSGASQASLIAAILSSEPPPISSIQKMAPPALDRLVKTCLAKDPDERWQSAHDVAAELRWIGEGGSQVGAPAPVVARRRNRERAAWGAALLLSVGMAAWLGARRPAAHIPNPVSFNISLPDTEVVEPALSHDATRLAFVAIDNTGKRTLRVRELAAITPREMPDSDGARSPFFAPDDSAIAFFAKGRLKHIALPSGPVTDLCEAGGSKGGFWTPDGQIVFTGKRGGLQILPASGGTARALTTLDTASHESSHEWPQLLPDGRRFLYAAEHFGEVPPDLVLASLGAAKRRVLEGIPASTLFAAPGFFVFTRGGHFFAQTVDPGTFERLGEPFPLAGESRERFDVRGTRALVYEAGKASDTELAWFDRSGAKISAVGKLAGYFFSTDLSPDGRHLAYERVVENARNIWVTDLARQTSTRLTFGAALDDSPVFSPDGSRIAFDSNQSGTWDIYTRASDGSGSDTLLLKPGADDVIVEDWSRDGRFLVYGVDRNVTDWDIWVLPFDGDRKPFPFLASRFREGQARLSPDGKFLAYSSDESGRQEVYAQSFPSGGRKTQISPAGGSQPMWRKDGKELFFVGEDSRINAVPLTQSKDGFEAGVPVSLFELGVPQRTDSPMRNRYAVTLDGNRFLASVAVRKDVPVSLQVVLDWPGLAR